MSYFDMSDQGMSGGPLRAVNDGVLGEYGPLRAVRDGSLGEYFAANGTGEYFAANGVGEYFAANGLGGPTAAEWMLAPGLAALRSAARGPTSGLGLSDGAAIGVGMAVALTLGIGVAGWLSYKAGTAMAPSKESKHKWGWVAVPVGLLFGAPGLGIMGIVSPNND